MDVALIFFGLCVGLLIGLTGIGGGSLMTPLLILAFGVKPIIAVGTDLAYGAITKTVGGVKHLRQRTVDVPLAVWMAFGSIPAALAGVYALETLERAHDDFDDVLLTLLAAALLLTGVATLARALLLKRLVARERAELDLSSGQKTVAVVLGAAVGFVLGVTSAGSGALIAVGLILIFQLIPTRVVGTDVFHAAILLWAAALAHLAAGNVDFELAGNILVGSVPGVWVGSHWSVRVPTAGLRLILALLLIGSGLGLLSKADVGVPGAALAAFPVMVVLLVAAAAAWDRRDRHRRAIEGAQPSGVGVPRARPMGVPGTEASHGKADVSDVERMSAEQVLAHMVERFHPRLYVACSFQKEASVIMDMLLRIEPEARFFTLDTGLLFRESYETWQVLERRYGVKVDCYQGMSLARQTKLHGERLWRRDPDKCCALRKVSPLEQALADVDAWITGLRRDQSPQRATTPKINWDAKHGLWKANPLADWSEGDVWHYLREHNVPYNELHDHGYDSIGCTHCTRPGGRRQGRWPGKEKTECGLHGTAAVSDTDWPR
jgi:phosphoadenylyl-sulfate reductase (thioredoxin)